MKVIRETHVLLIKKRQSGNGGISVWGGSVGTSRGLPASCISEEEIRDKWVVVSKMKEFTKEA